MSLLDKTNLLITANAVKAGKLYSVIPASGTSDCTVVRNTTATRINSAGLVVNVAANIARINYPTLGGDGFILDEAQSTNLLLFSEEFNNSFWGSGTNLNPFGSGSIANAIASPDGLITADYIQENTVNTVHRVQNGQSKINSALPYTLSIFVKKKERDRISLVLDDGTTNGCNCVFDLTNGTFNTPSFQGSGFSALSASIKLFANGYYRCALRVTTNSSTAIRAQIQLHNGTSNVYAGTGVSGLYIWGIQLEQKDIESSYIPTASAAVTRNSDLITATSPAGTVKITTTFSDDTTQVFTTIPATYTVPEGLIKQVLMQKTL